MKKFMIILAALGIFSAQILPASNVFAEENPIASTAETQTSEAETSRGEAENINTNFTIDAHQTTVESGQMALFDLNLKVSGKDTVYHNANLKIQLPTAIDGSNINFNQNLEELKVNGVVPVYDAATQTLIYHYDQLAPGLANRVLLQIATDNGGVLNGSILNVSGEFTADELTAPLTSSATTTVTANKNIALTNKILNVESSNDNPAQGDTVVFGVGFSATKKTSGSLYLKPGTPIHLTYQLDKYFTYEGLSDSGMEEPTVTGNTLTWDFVAPSIEDQKVNANFFNRNFNVRAKINQNAPNFAVLTNIASGTFTFVDDQTTTNTQNAVVTVSPSDPTTVVPSPSSGGYAFAHWGPIDGFGNLGETTSDYDPVVYDNNILAFADIITPLYATSTTIPFMFYNVYYNIDPHLTLGNFILGSFIFRPDSSYGNKFIPLKNRPIAALLVQYEGDSTWHPLTMDLALDKVTNLETLGADMTKKVTKVWLWFHRSDVTDYSNPEKVKFDPGYKAISMAPAGMYGKFQMNFSIEQGYVGKVINTTNVTFYGAFPNGNAAYVNEDDITWASQPAWAAKFSSRSASVTTAPAGIHKVVQGTVQMDKTDGNMLASGENTVSTTVASNKASLTRLTGPFTNYILLPTGVEYVEDPTITQYDVSLASTNYHNTGRQLVKVTWNDESLLASQSLKATFKVNVTKNAVKNLVINLIGTTSDKDELVAPEITGAPTLTDTTVEQDADDINNDGNKNEYVFKSANSYILDQSQYLDIHASVKGDKDKKFGAIGNVSTGSSATFKLEFTNNSDDKITSMNFLDILPTVGDYNITDGLARDSKYEMKLTGPIEIPSSWKNKVEIVYSTASNPKRAGILDADTHYPTGAEHIVDPAGATEPTWLSESAVTDWSTIHAYKIVLKKDVEWIQGKGLVLTFNLQAPNYGEVDSGLVLNKPNSAEVTLGTPANRLAFNSFGVATNHLQVVETSKVGVQLIRATQPVTVNYFDEKGNVIASSESLKGYYGEAYQAEQKKISGYNFDRVEGAVTGTYSDGANQVVNFYYKHVVAPVTVKYQDEKGNKLAPSRVLKGDYGATYTTEKLNILGYKFKKVSGKENGTFTNEAKTVIYTYEAVKSGGGTTTPTDNNSKPTVNKEKNKTTLPQTGEKILSSLWLSGLTLVLIGGLAYWFKPKN